MQLDCMKKLPTIKQLFEHTYTGEEPDTTIVYYDCFLKRAIPKLGFVRGELIRKIKLYYKKGRKTGMLELFRLIDFPPRKMRIKI